MDNSFTLCSNKEADNVKILQSCNGLLLCSGSVSPVSYYVYNPSTNLFKRLTQPENSHDDLHLHATGVLRMAFDLTKLCDYKVVQLFACPHSDLEIQVYSSETETEDRQLTLYKLNIDDHDHPFITTIEIPNGLHQGRNFLQFLTIEKSPMYHRRIILDSYLCLRMVMKSFDAFRGVTPRIAEIVPQRVPARQ
nr:hypothetical protein [Tanacetum cinerariifolium]